MDRRNFLQFAAIGGITSKLLEGCSTVAKSQTINKKLMSEVYLKQSPENLKKIFSLVEKGKSNRQLEDFLNDNKGEIYVAHVDRSDRYKQISQGFLPSPQKVGENKDSSIIQLPKKDIIIVGIIKELNQIPKVVILESLQRHSIYSIVDRNGNYVRESETTSP